MMKIKAWIIPILMLPLFYCSVQNEPSYAFDEWICNCEGIKDELKDFVAYAPKDEILWKELEVELVDHIPRKEIYVGLTLYSEGRILYDTSSFLWHYDRRRLVWHELGHYLLHREHTDDMIYLDGKIKPKSVMHSSKMAGIKDNEKLKDYYLTELFASTNSGY